MPSNNNTKPTIKAFNVCLDFSIFMKILLEIKLFTSKKICPKWGILENPKRFFFSHPDSTVGSGITPDHANARGLYRRYGISPNPEVNMNFFYNNYYCRYYLTINDLDVISSGIGNSNSSSNVGAISDKIPSRSLIFLSVTTTGTGFVV